MWAEKLSTPARSTRGGAQHPARRAPWIGTTRGQRLAHICRDLTAYSDSAGRPRGAGLGADVQARTADAPGSLAAYGSTGGAASSGWRPKQEARPAGGATDAQCRADQRDL